MKQKDEFYWQCAEHVTDFQRLEVFVSFVLFGDRKLFETPVILCEIAKRRNSVFAFSVLDKVKLFSFSHIT